MKRTVSVNIKGMNFLIEEDAYELLQQYIDRLTHVFRNDKGSKEIIEDIELRVAELCLSKLNDRKQVVEIDDIRSILNTLGDPAQFVDEEVTDSENYSQTSTDKKQNSGEKRLFRDLDNASIAGVCSGIANYLNIDVVIIRAIFLVIFLFGGFGFPLYVILWIVIPKANTTIDKLRMRGKPITVESVKEEVETAAERLTKESKRFAKKIRNEENVGRRFTSLGRFITGAVGIGLICFGLFLLVMFLIFGIGGMEFIPVQSETGFLSLPQFGKLVLNDISDYNWAWWGAVISCFTGILFILLLGVKLLFRIRNRWSGISLGLLFTAGFIGIVMCIVIGAKTGREMAIEGEIEREVGKIAANELQVIAHQSSFKSSADFKVKSDGRYGLIGLKGDNIVESGIHLEYRLSKDSLFHVYQNLSSHSHSHKTALDKAKNIKHSVSLDSSQLHINTYYSYPKRDKLRDQEVYIIIEIPKGKTVEIGNQTIHLGAEDFKEDVKNDFYEEDGYLRNDGEYDHWD
jgi:phage shock protein PspC (stress-responsive transcriptional regulator)